MSEAITEIEQLADLAESQDANQESEWQATDLAVGDDGSASMETAELCTAILSIGFSLIGSRRGAHWELNRTEADETGKAIGAVLDKYFPDLAGSSGAEVTAVMTLGMVLMGRFAEDKRIHEKEVGPKANDKPPKSETRATNDAPENAGFDLSNVDAA
jgi:hypothetical protein